MVGPQTIRSLLLFSFFALTACSGGGADAQLSPQQDLGRRLFSQRCASCHVTSGDTAIMGPSLAGIASEAGGRIPGLEARAYIQQSILQPSAYLNPGYNDLMPQTFGQILPTDDLNALISYLLTLE